MYQPLGAALGSENDPSYPTGSRGQAGIPYPGAVDDYGDKEDDFI